MNNPNRPPKVGATVDMLTKAIAKAVTDAVAHTEHCPCYRASPVKMCTAHRVSLETIGAAVVDLVRIAATVEHTLNFTVVPVSKLDRWQA